MESTTETGTPLISEILNKLKNVRRSVSNQITILLDTNRFSNFCDEANNDFVHFGDDFSKNEIAVKVNISGHNLVIINYPKEDTFKILGAIELKNSQDIDKANSDKVAEITNSLEEIDKKLNDLSKDTSVSFIFKRDSRYSSGSIEVFVDTNSAV